MNSFSSFKVLQVVQLFLVVYKLISNPKKSGFLGQSEIFILNYQSIMTSRGMKAKYLIPLYAFYLIKTCRRFKFLFC